MKQPFENAVETHGQTVMRVCRAALGPGTEAEDAWSETFLAAMKAWPQLDAQTNVQAWLVRVAQRKTIDVLRARSRGAVPVDSVPETASPWGNPDVENHHVWQAVGALPQRQRLSVAYHFLGGLSHAQTAELIGGSAASVRRASADGVRALREALGHEAQFGTSQTSS
ncbi:RNA polymerase sigma factor [Kocuria sp.]|uniref:RNA polymerase sigma factor n=1 Tax=Kocuria sp. TaxID=1871328 RepID=UPI0026DF46F5|nr:sigma-70 family RNA polymerase sigma factor [Kocuria sp.]MDO5618253.1 sigma-70 family RNA polymerase sigma factor [Kocuria sp.]